ncbi:hypothetical protein T11_16408 [Trichinella zimbabwensis]|uniref:Uncharacterized protein n=1 Tax=Trichinella zimbabwensis TaxID=268475 RepID=A0A0V1HF71_9BILA|nr:hypothetical protein T11_16408 [Trichinella zimbabwensis]
MVYQLKLLYILYPNLCEEFSSSQFCEVFVRIYQNLWNVSERDGYQSVFIGGFTLPICLSKETALASSVGISVLLPYQKLLMQLDRAIDPTLPQRHP